MAPAQLIRRLAWRIMPVLGMMYVISFLDRVNLGFAALRMNAQLGISPLVFGTAAGIFFLGYLLFQVPANLLLARVGARRWLALIMLAWGVVSLAMAFVTSATSLLVVRFLLGVAEAGFFPGAILYLTLWFPPLERGRIVSLFMIAAPIAYIIGAPLSGVILSSFEGWHGLAAWQWLFVFEALPAVLLAPLVFLLLQDRPQHSSWLDAQERDWLLAQQQLPATATAPVSVAGSAAGPAMGVQLLPYALIYFALQMGVYGIGLWLPQIVAASGRSQMTTAWLSAVPYLLAIPTMLLWGRFGTGVHGVRASSVWLPQAGAGVVLAGSALLVSFAGRFVGLILMTMCLFACLPLFWAYATSAHQRLFGPLGISLVNAAGSLGSFAGPLFVGWIRQYTTGFNAALAGLGTILVASGALLALTVGRHRNTRSD